MNSIRTNRVLRTMFVVSALLGWVALSQRCALWQLMQGRLATAAAAAQHDCCHPDAPKPGEAPDHEPRKPECCMALHVLVPDGAQLPGATLTASLPIPGEWIFDALETMSAKDIIVLDTGPPPDVPAFVEVVLHRSLHSHAPPSLA